VIGGQRHSPAALIPVKDTGAYITGGWVGPRADLDGRENNVSFHHRGSNTETSTP
jgi:hypothetical protein